MGWGLRALFPASLVPEPVPEPEPGMAPPAIPASLVSGTGTGSGSGTGGGTLFPEAEAGEDSIQDVLGGAQDPPQ